jgi:hypothetical protein
LHDLFVQIRVIRGQNSTLTPRYQRF